MGYGYSCFFVLHYFAQTLESEANCVLYVDKSWMCVFLSFILCFLWHCTVVLTFCDYCCFSQKGPTVPRSCRAASVRELVFIKQLSSPPKSFFFFSFGKQFWEFRLQLICNLFSTQHTNKIMLTPASSTLIVTILAYLLCSVASAM